MDIHELEYEVSQEFNLDKITSTDELEQVVRKIGIPIADFSGTDLRVGIAVAEAIGAIFKKYPALKHTVCAIGGDESINFHVNVLFGDVEHKDKYKGGTAYKEYITCPDSWIRYIYVLNKNNRVIYDAFVLGSHYKEHYYEVLLRNINKAASTQFHPEHENSIQSMIYHEFGHVLSNMLNLRKNKILINAFKQKIKDTKIQVSGYASHQKDEESILEETIAEAIAEYIMFPKTNNKVVKLIGEVVDAEYCVNCNSDIFKVNDHFGENYEMGTMNR